MALALVSDRPLRPRTTSPLARRACGSISGTVWRCFLPSNRNRLGSIVTSPPYNIGIRYRSYQDDLPRTEYLNWTDRWVRMVARRESPRLVLPECREPSPPIPGFRSRSPRSSAGTSGCRTRFTGSSRSPSTGRPSGPAPGSIATSRSVTTSRSTATGSSTTATSSFFISRRAGGRRSTAAPSACRIRIGRTSRAGPTAGNGLRCRGNTWFIPYETIQSRDRDRPHPASFPPKVPEQCLRLHGLTRAGVVLDPFLGLGATAVAAARLGLDFIGDRDGRALPQGSRQARQSAAPVVLSQVVAPGRFGRRTLSPERHKSRPGWSTMCRSVWRTLRAGAPSDLE